MNHGDMPFEFPRMFESEFADQALEVVGWIMAFHVYLESTVVAKRFEADVAFIGIFRGFQLNFRRLSPILLR